MGHIRTRLAAAIWLGALLVLPRAGLAAVKFSIVDRDGEPVPEVVVYARNLDAGARDESVADARTVAINQQDLDFDPHITVVQTGTEIRFPNSDEVRHHVYSFSPARRFDLTVDSGSVRGESLRFDTAGVVTLGCNIHDDMRAYVLVVDTTDFAMTGADGSATLSLRPGRYEISIWTSRLSPKSLPEPLIVDLSAGETLEIASRMEHKLYPPHRNSKTSLLWDSY